MKILVRVFCVSGDSIFQQRIEILKKHYKYDVNYVCPIGNGLDIFIFMELVWNIFDHVMGQSGL